MCFHLIYFLFSMLLYFVMAHLTLQSLYKQLTLNTNLNVNYHDIRYADGTTLTSNMTDKLQFATAQLKGACKWGMKINKSKCKVITSSDKHIILENEELECVREFCCFM